MGYWTLQKKGSINLKTDQQKSTKRRHRGKKIK